MFYEKVQRHLFQIQRQSAFILLFNFLLENPKNSIYFGYILAKYKKDFKQFEIE